MPSLFHDLIHVFSALITAFGTGSSSATLPVTIQCIEEKNGVSQQVARFDFGGECLYSGLLV